MGLDLKEEFIDEPDISPQKIALREKVKRFFRNPKKRLLFIIILGLVLISIVVLGFYFLNPKNIQTKKNNLIKKKQETLYQAPLDGLEVDIDSSKRHPLAIMVENHTAARPQTGLNRASVIYEAIAEGGITRFMPIFGTYECELVGPVRSSRPYFVDWLEGYNAYYAHVGGNATALDKIISDQVLDLDQFHYPTPYWRDRSLKVASEHTMFTSTTKLRVQANENKYSTANNFRVYKFKDDSITDCDENITQVEDSSSCSEYKLRPQKQTITIDISSKNYNVYYKYDRESNSYLRFMAGKAHKDRLSDNQLNPKNVIVMTVSRSPLVTRINEKGWNMDNMGSGDAKIFIDGKEFSGSWKKNSSKEREVFYDQDGKEIVFNRGQFWITAIPPEGSVSVETTSVSD